MDEAVKEYELLCILSPRLEGTDLDKAKNEISESVTRFGGTISFKESSKKPLAYPINKEQQGLYLISHISIGPEKITNLMKELKLNKQILRHIVSQLEIPETAETRKTTKVKKPIIAKKTLVRKEKPTEANKPIESGTLEEIDKKLDELIREI